MTPAQKRLLFPLRPMTTFDRAMSAINVFWTFPPGSILFAAGHEYCRTVAERLDPMPPHVIK